MKQPDANILRTGCYTDEKAEDCHKLADFLKLNENDQQKAGQLYKVNCDKYGFARSCLEYGNYVFVGLKEKGQEPNPVEALKYFEKGCHLGSDENCLNSGLLLVSPKLHGSPLARDLPKGMEYLNKSCDMANGNACFYLSGMYMTGADSSLSYDNSAKKEQTKIEDFQIGKDLEKAFSFSVKACELGNLFACANLSKMYATGQGIEKNAEKSDHYKKMTENLSSELRRQQILLRFSHP